MKTTLSLLVFLFTVVLNAQCFQSISTDDGHSLAIKTGGTLWSWGKNVQGELGLNSYADYHNIPIRIGHEIDWSKIFVQGNKSFVIKNNGTLWACGDGGAGGLGTGNQYDKLVLTQIGTDTNWDYVTSGAGTVGTLALKTDGTLWGWGANFYGMLSLGVESMELTPVQISAETNWAKVIAGPHYTLAIKDDGTLWACGQNFNGQLGDGTNSNRLNFVQIGTDTNWVDIAVGTEKSSFGIKSDGTLWGWGANRIIIPFVSSNNHMFVNTLPNNLTVPTQLVTVTNCSKVSASFSTYVVLKNDGTLWKSIDGTGLNQIGNDTDWDFIDMGAGHFFAMKTDGTLWVQGDNSYGQLGLGSTILSTSVLVPLDCSAFFLGVNEVTSLSKISLYPNPTSDLLTIAIDQSIAISFITIYNTLGQLVLSIAEPKNAIDVSSLKTGTYFIKITSDIGTANSKFIKI